MTTENTLYRKLYSRDVRMGISSNTIISLLIITLNSGNNSNNKTVNNKQFLI